MESKKENLLVGNCNQKEQNMLSTYHFGKIRQMREVGKNISEISRDCKISRKTVRRYLVSNSQPKYPKRKVKSVTLLSAIQDSVNSILQKNPKNSRWEVQKLLLKESKEASLTTIGRAISNFKATKSKERFFEQTYEAGEQCQVDFKEEILIPFEHGEQLTQLFVAKLPFSDIVFIKGFPNKNFICFAHGLQAALEYFGGVPRHVRLDNLSPCVIKVGKGKARTYTKSFVSFREHYGFGTPPCAPGKGSDKGAVERCIQSHYRWLNNEIINQNLVFKDWEHFNSWVQNFLDSLQTMQEKENFEAERQKFRPLPAADEAVVCQTQSATISKWGNVKIDKAIYSCPDTHIGEACDVIIGPWQVEIRPLKKACASIFHPRKQPGEESILPEHFLPWLMRKPGAMMRWAHKRVLFPSAHAKAFYENLQSLDQDTAEKNYLTCFYFTLAHGWSEVEAAMEMLSNHANPVLEFALLFQKTEWLAPAGPEPITPNIEKYNKHIPNLEDYTHECSTDTTESEAIETHSYGHISSGVPGQQQGKETLAGNNSVGANAVGTESTFRTESAAPIEEVADNSSETPIDLRTKGTAGDKKRRHRRVRPGRLGQKSAQRSPLRRIWSRKNASSFGNYKGYLPTRSQLPIYNSAEVNDTAPGSKARNKAEPVHEGAGQARLDSVRRTGLCFRDRRKCRIIFSAHSGALRTQEHAVHQQSCLWRMGQSICKNSPDTGCFRQNTSSLQSDSHSWAQRPNRAESSRRNFVDAESLSS